MTTIVEALNRIARQCSVSVPSSWISTTRADQVELRDDFLQETVTDITDRVDLPSPISGQFELNDDSTGSVILTSPVASGGGEITYSLPSDFKRLQRNENCVYDLSQDRPCMPLTRDGDWERIKDLGTAGIVLYYRIVGYDGNWTIEFLNEATDGSNIIISYVSTNWMATTGGAVGSAFTSETDVLLFPRRVVESGTVWRFRERRGLPYLDKFNESEALIARLSNDTRARRVVSFGGGDDNVRWQDLIPSFIPSS